jgi:hypothetical protein
MHGAGVQRAAFARAGRGVLRRARAGNCEGATRAVGELTAQGLGPTYVRHVLEPRRTHHYSVISDSTGWV